LTDTFAAHMGGFLKRISLTHWILISMVVGVLIGWLFPAESQELKVVSNLFLKMIKCILVPLVFGTLVVGIASHSDDLKTVGRLAIRSLIYFEVVTTLALFIGLGVVNIARPGIGVRLPPPDPTSVVTPAKVTISGIIEHIGPKSFFEAAAQNDVLQIVFFAIVFAIALAQVPADHRLVMTAALFLRAHNGGRLPHPDAVRKSFPNFFNLFS
jgi:proton glutamate symport protein